MDQKNKNASMPDGLYQNQDGLQLGISLKNHIKSFEIEGFTLLEFGNSKWKDGIALEYISD